MKLKSYNKWGILVLFLLSRNIVLGQNLDTLYVNLDSLTACRSDTLVEISYSIPRSYCGTKLSIPVSLITRDTSMFYIISNLLGNGDSSFSGSTTDIISTNNKSHYWGRLHENLYNEDCSKNRSYLNIRINYGAVDKNSERSGIFHRKRIKIKYQYTN